MHVEGGGEEIMKIVDANDNATRISQHSPARTYGRTRHACVREKSLKTTEARTFHTESRQAVTTSGDEVCACSLTFSTTSRRDVGS